MRAAPVGLFFADDVEAMVRVAAAQSALTHRHPTAIASSVAAAAAVAHDVREGTLAGMPAFVRECVERIDGALLVASGCPPALAETIGTREMLAALGEVEARRHDESDDVCALLGGAWVGEEAVACALWCVGRGNGHFRETVLRGAKLVRGQRLDRVHRGWDRGSAGRGRRARTGMVPAGREGRDARFARPRSPSSQVRGGGARDLGHAGPVRCRSRVTRAHECSSSAGAVLCAVVNRSPRDEPPHLRTAALVPLEPRMARSMLVHPVVSRDSPRTPRLEHPLWRPETVGPSRVAAAHDRTVRIAATLSRDVTIRGRDEPSKRRDP